MSENFQTVFSHIKTPCITRQNLIELVIKVTQLTENQAVGLVNRNIHQLKKQGVLQSSGGHYNKKYTFSEVLFQLKQESYHLPAKQTALKNELLITQYELQAYDDLLNQCPTEKKKIIKLHKKTSDKLYQLHGQLRAINQLLTY